MSKEGVIELLLMAKKATVTGDTFSTQLKNDERFYPTLTNKTLFDLDPIRLRYQLNQYQEDPNSISEADLSIITQFAQKFKLINNNVLDYVSLEKYFKFWTQRILDLLDSKMVMKNLSDFTNAKGIIDFDSYFGEDTLVADIFDDVKKHYIAKNSKQVFETKINSAELVLPNIYKSTFSNESDALVHIANKGMDYFKEILQEDFKEDTNPYDLKINTLDGKEIYVKFTTQLPTEQENPNIFQADQKNGQEVYYRLGDKGEYLYVKPANSKMLVVNGADVLYIKISSEKDGANIIHNDIKQRFKNFIESIDGIRSIVPIMNNTVENVINRAGEAINFRETILRYYSDLVKIRFTSNYKVSADWYTKNRLEIIDKLSKKQFASWEKSHEFIAARIPAQSMQSFMSMKNVAYFNTKSNNAYVSVWQIWLQGSDFDIDKAYIMGYGFNKGAQFDIWTNMFDYNNKQELDAIETLPIPSNIILKNTEENIPNVIKYAGYDLSEDVVWFNNIANGLTNSFEIAKNMSSEDIIRFGKLLRNLSRKNESLDLLLNRSDFSVEEQTQYANQIIKPSANNTGLLEFINFYNGYKGFLHSKYTLQNSIVSKIKSIIDTPSNQMLATAPVTISVWHEGADIASNVKKDQIKLILKDWFNNKEETKPAIEILIATLADINLQSLTKDEINNIHKLASSNSIEQNIKDTSQIVINLIARKDRFSSDNSVGMFKQQYQASMGKQDVGIGANGLKVFFALSTYYNEWYRGLQDNSVGLDTISDNKLFLKEFNIKDASTGKMKTHVRVSIADTRISKDIFQSVLKQYGYSELEGELKEINKIQAALAISGFVSGATDNAKELIMAKINAVVELSSMHLYMLALGFSASEISVYMNSDIAKYVANNISTNLFADSTSNYVAGLIKEYKSIPEKLSLYADESEMIKVADTFEDIYNGGQEFGVLASIFKVNGAISANVIELNKFLNVLERGMFNAEMATFEFDTVKLKSITSNSLSEGKDYEIVTTAVLQELTTGQITKAVMIDNTSVTLSTSNLVFKDLIIKILQNNAHLRNLSKDNFNEVISYIINTLKEASQIKVSFIDYYNKEEVREVSILGGQFDSRYYIHPKNTEYIRAATNYYNLLKNTINIFDVLENVPHFREMTHGVGTIFNIALLSSKKFNFVFSLYRDYIKENEQELLTGDGKKDRLKRIMGNPAFPIEIDEAMINKSMGVFDNYMIAGWLKSSATKDNKANINISDFKFSVKALLKKADLKEIPVYTSSVSKVYSKEELKDAKKAKITNVTDYQTIITADGDSDIIIDLSTDHGIANFKQIFEEVFFAVLEKSKDSSITDILTTKNIRNILGLFGSQITPTYNISSLNNPISIENFLKLLNEFNGLDSKVSNEHKLVNIKGQTMKWQDLLYVYNLITNYESYGDNRLTPFFEDYVKDTSTIAHSYLAYSTMVDRGEVDVFGIDEENLDIKAVLKRQQINNIFLLSLHKNGFLKIGTDNLRTKNTDFVINTILPKLGFQEGVDYQIAMAIQSLIRNRNLIINYNCI